LTAARCAGGFTPDGKLVVTTGGDNDGTIRTWNPKTGACTAIVPSGHLGHSAAGATCLAISSDSALALSGGVDGSIVLSNVVSGKAVAKVREHNDSVESVAIANDRPLLVSGSMDGSVVIWDMNVAAKRGLCPHSAGVVTVAMQNHGPLFATACLDGLVRVFDVRTAKAVATCGGHRDAVQALAWSPDDIHIASGSDDHSVRVFQCVA
jgi:angio-associated migratory cell protein